MKVSERQTCHFEDVEIDVLSGRVVRGGDQKRLRQKSFEVLLYLLQHHDRVVDKQELFDAVWSDTAVTDDALVQCIKEIRRALGDDIRHPRFIRTVPRKGYRFIATPHTEQQLFVHKEEVTRVENDDGDSPSDPRPVAQVQSPQIRNYFSRYWLPLAAALLLGLAATTWVMLGSADVFRSRADNMRLASAAGQKGVVVLFFENSSQTADLDWLSRGLTDMLINDLSRSGKLSVLSRDQLERIVGRNGTYSNGSAGRASEIAGGVGADYAVTGAFFKIGDSIRVDVQLLNVSDNSSAGTESLIVEKPDRILMDIELLCLRLMKRLGVQRSETQPSLAESMTNDLEAYRLYSLGMEKASGMHKAEALDLLEKAVARDPNFAMAHARIGYVYAVTWGWADKAKPHLERAFQMANRLTEKDRLYITAWYAIANMDFPSAIPPLQEIIQKYPTETEAYVRLGYLLRGEEQFDKAIDVMQRGLSVDPESPELCNSLGLLYSLLGRHDEATAMHRRYVDLEPQESNSHDSLGLSYQWGGRYEEAIAEYQRSLELNPNFEVALAHLGVAYYQTGHYQEALKWFRKYEAVAPGPMERSRAYSYIAHVYRTLGDLNAAKTPADQALKAGFYSFEPLVVFSETGDAVKSRKAEKGMFPAPIFNTRGSRNLIRYDIHDRAYLELAHGKTEQGLADMAEALRHPPATWEIDSDEDCLATAYLQMGRLDEAIAEYQRVLQINPRYPLAHFHIAEAYDRKGETATALDHYRLFLQTWDEADENIPEVIASRNKLRNAASGLGVAAADETLVRVPSGTVTGAEVR